MGQRDVSQCTPRIRQGEINVENTQDSEKFHITYHLYQTTRGDKCGEDMADEVSVCTNTGNCLMMFLSQPHNNINNNQTNDPNKPVYLDDFVQVVCRLGETDDRKQHRTHLQLHPQLTGQRGAYQLVSY